MARGKVTLLLILSLVSSKKFIDWCIDEDQFRLNNKEKIKFPRLEELVSTKAEIAGSGMQGSVHKVIFNRKNVVLKISDLKNKYVDLNLIENELRGYSVVEGIENVPKFFGCFYKKDYFAFILEDAGVNLASSDSHLRKSKILRIIDALLSVSKTIAGIHARGLRHQDITTKNVLVKDNQKYFVTDFGISCMGGESRFPVINQPYSPPELREANYTDCSRRVDVWQMGLLAADLFLMKENKAVTDFMSPGCNKNYTDSCYKNFYRDLEAKLKIENVSLHDLIFKCLKQSPEDRPSSFEVIHQKLEIIMNQEVSNFNKLWNASRGVEPQKLAPPAEPVRPIKVSVHRNSPQRHRLSEFKPIPLLPGWSTNMEISPISVGGK